MDNLPEKIDSKFRYVLLASQRAEQLMRGARPKVDLRDKKQTVQAMAEVREDRIDWEYGPAPVKARPEVVEELVEGEVAEAAEGEAATEE